MDGWHGFCKSKSMNKTTFITTMMMAAALSFAAESFVRPESSVPTPAQNAEISKEMPNLGAKESEDWQRMRAERRQAREQILSNLRNNAALEKQDMRQNVSKNRNENARFEGEFPKNQNRERHPFYERPESQPMYPSRDMPGPAFEGDRYRQ